MRISHRYKFVFLANPRTASTSVRSVLDPYSDISGCLGAKTTADFPFSDHIFARHLKAVFDERGWDWDAYTVFCVVRNPFDRMISLYHHQQKIHAKTGSFSSYLDTAKEYGPKHATKMLALNLTRPRNFKDFLKAANTQKALTTSLKNFAFDESGCEQMVDHILRFENLHVELPALLSELGIDVSKSMIPVLNSAKRGLGTIQYYDKEAIEIMHAKYGYEIERFSYEPL